MTRIRACGQGSWNHFQSRPIDPAFAFSFRLQTGIGVTEEALKPAVASPTLKVQTQHSRTARYVADARTMLDPPGVGPVLVDRSSAQITLQTDGPRQVYALDASGARGALVPSTFENGKLKFSVAREASTVWFAILKP